MFFIVFLGVVLAHLDSVPFMMKLNHPEQPIEHEAQISENSQELFDLSLLPMPGTP